MIFGLIKIAQFSIKQSKLLNLKQCLSLCSLSEKPLSWYFKLWISIWDLNFWLSFSWMLSPQGVFSGPKFRIWGRIPGTLNNSKFQKLMWLNDCSRETQDMWMVRSTFPLSLTAVSGGTFRWFLGLSKSQNFFSKNQNFWILSNVFLCVPWVKNL